MTVKVKYTNGAGNNIFQYVYARLLAEIQQDYLSTERLEFLDVSCDLYDYDSSAPIVEIDLKESDFHQYLDKRRPYSNYFVHTYPEDYTIYKPHLDKIRSWFTDIPKMNSKDLVLHLRLGDRLLSKRDHDPSMKVSFKEYANVISKFDYERLYIVTDMKNWKCVDEDDISKMKFHVDVDSKNRATAKESSDYLNSLINGFSEYDPIVRCGNTIREDFNFMRSFDKILFQHGTLAWWAATLSHASQVGVYGPWRPIKGNRNKNLGNTDFDGWFSWGK